MRTLPFWENYRTLAGAAGAGWVDNANLADASLNPTPPGTFPTIQAARYETILVYWTATGENRAIHTLTIEPLIRDGANNLWVVQPTFDLLAREVAEVPVHDCSIVGLRIHAQAAAGASAAVLRWTGGQPARR